jgi:hypothetical protein
VSATLSIRSNIFEGPLDREFELAVDHRLGEIVESPQANRFHGAFDRPEPRQEDHRRFGRELPRRLQDPQAVFIRKADVAEHDVEAVFADPGQRFPAGPRGFDAVADAAEVLGHRFEDELVVVDEQQRAVVHRGLLRT